MPPPALVVFAGLPGTGKTTLARSLAARARAGYLRIDSVEVALKLCSLAIHPAVDAGYAVAYALARDNLSVGLTVVADGVNPIALTRRAFEDVAAAAGATLLRVEVVCSDAAEHRRRVETRRADLDGHRLPTWDDVLARPYEPWDCADLVLDSSQLAIEDAVGMLLDRLGWR